MQNIPPHRIAGAVCHIYLSAMLPPHITHSGAMEDLNQLCYALQHNNGTFN